MKTPFALRAVTSGLLVAAFAVTGCRGWETDKPPVHLNWNMDTQEKGKAFRKSDFFADGRYMRTPPKGTVAAYMKNENRFRVVEAQDAGRYARLVAAEDDFVRRRWAIYEKIAAAAGGGG